MPLSQSQPAVLVTGGAGFIGSHLVDQLLASGWRVRVVDDLTTGRLENLAIGHARLEFLEGDLRDPGLAARSVQGMEGVFHLAANAEVWRGAVEPQRDFGWNLVATFNLLEGVRRLEPRPRLVFASSSTVYGEAKVVRTPETYGPLHPISVHGATKLGCEALLEAYAHTFDVPSVAVRIANVVGARGRHGVVWDFLQKLKQNRRELEILGDGTQRKSYVHVSDCVAALLACYVKLENEQTLGAVNAGSRDQVTVLRIAELVCKAADVEDVILRSTGGVKGGRGWSGDIKQVWLDASRLETWGWRPQMNSEEAVSRAARELAPAAGFHA